MRLKIKNQSKNISSLRIHATQCPQNNELQLRDVFFLFYQERFRNKFKNLNSDANPSFTFKEFDIPKKNTVNSGRESNVPNFLNFLPNPTPKTCLKY